ncbi:MAG: GDP-mannose 4,6-dehydratase [Candidatus Aenigmarchaeota archaeon]|nr:GDP-mannose 4,6-dehydratase [Candidatus Aenigmarchaeota archaeon]
MANILITGGNGLIGSHLAEKLTEHNVTLFDIAFGKNTEHLKCKKITGDIKKFSDVKAAAHNQDYVVHLAAVSRVAWGQEDPLKCIETNVMGTSNVLEAIRATGAYFFLGSSREVYGEPQYFPVDEKHPKNPISLYGVTKSTGENLALSYHKHFGARTIIFRFSNVYGSKRDLPQRVIPKFVNLALKNQDIILYGGDQILDFTFIDDVVGGIRLALKKADKIVGEDFHFVNGKGTSVKELAELIVLLSGSKSRIVPEAPKNFDVKKFIGDTSKAKRMLGYEPTTGLKEGLKKTIALYQGA